MNTATIAPVTLFTVRAVIGRTETDCGQMTLLQARSDAQDTSRTLALYDSLGKLLCRLEGHTGRHLKV